MCQSMQATSLPCAPHAFFQKDAGVFPWLTKPGSKAFRSARTRAEQPAGHTRPSTQKSTCLGCPDRPRGPSNAQSPAIPSADSGLHPTARGSPAANAEPWAARRATWHLPMPYRPVSRLTLKTYGPTGAQEPCSAQGRSSNSSCPSWANAIQLLGV